MPSSDPEAWFGSFREGQELHRRTAPETPAPVRQLDRYELGERIGEGGAAEVFRARDRELGREVAVKILHESLGSSATVRERFQREAKVTAGLSHPHLLTIHDAGETGGRLYLVMELVDGRPLGELLAQRNYEIKTMVRLLEKVARGVAAAHERGIVHRDLKPGNILVSRGGEPKVADFGLAHIAGSEVALTQQGTVMGTPLYMAPEQVRGRTSEIGPRTDVYALGAILYEILTGRPPHVGESVTEIYGRIMNEDPSAPRRLNARVSADLETIALKALEKDPQRRYDHAGLFADDLHRYLEGEPILASPPGAVTIARKWARRHRTTTAVAVVILLAAGVLVAAVLQQRFTLKRDIATWLDKGRKARDDYDRGSAHVAELRLEEKKLSASPDAGQPLWDLQARIGREQKAADTFYDDSLTAFTSAFALDTSDPGPRKELATHYFHEFERAERQGDERAMARSIRSLDLYDDGTFGREIAREVDVAIDTRPSGAEVELLRYEEGGDGRLVETLEKKLGRGPIALKLKPGAWLFVLRQAERRETRLPIYAERGRACRLCVDLYTEAEIGRDYVYVPAGPFISGGDQRVQNPTERRIAEAGGFFIAACETTIAEYCEFLNDLLDQGKWKEALARQPRTQNVVVGDLQFPAGRRFGPPPGTQPDEPISMIAWNDAAEFTRWKTRRSAESGRNEVFRLPTEEEWEKAARGADGRAYPWGNTFDLSFANVGHMVDGRFFRVRVGDCEKDRSPYGIFDMAGGVEECCDGYFDEARGFRSTRGATMWTIDPDYFRIAWRGGSQAHGPSQGRGIRLVKDLPRK